MAVAQNKELMAPFLDRLIDAGQSNDAGPIVYTLDQMIHSVCADLEDLLNTRQSRSMVECPYPLVRQSILAYGLPDLNSIPGASSNDHEAIGNYIGGLIEHFEPRLKNVRVEIVADDSIPRAEVRQLRYEISALLNVDPAPEVGFETIVDVATGQAKVKTSARLT